MGTFILHLIFAVLLVSYAQANIDDWEPEGFLDTFNNISRMGHLVRPIVSQISTTTTWENIIMTFGASITGKRTLVELLFKDPEKLCPTGLDCIVSYARAPTAFPTLDDPSKTFVYDLMPIEEAEGFGIEHVSAAILTHNLTAQASNLKLLMVLSYSDVVDESSAKNFSTVVKGTISFLRNFDIAQISKSLCVAVVGVDAKFDGNQFLKQLKAKMDWKQGDFSGDELLQTHKLNILNQVIANNKCIIGFGNLSEVYEEENDAILLKRKQFLESFGKLEFTPYSNPCEKFSIKLDPLVTKFLKEEVSKLNSKLLLAIKMLNANLVYRIEYELKKLSSESKPSPDLLQKVSALKTKYAKTCTSFADCTKRILRQTGTVLNLKEEDATFRELKFYGKLLLPYQCLANQDKDLHVGDRLADIMKGGFIEVKQFLQDKSLLPILEAATPLLKDIIDAVNTRVKTTLGVSMESKIKGNLEQMKSQIRNDLRNDRLLPSDLVKKITEMVKSLKKVLPNVVDPDKEERAVEKLLILEKVFGKTILKTEEYKGVLAKWQDLFALVPVKKEEL